jgi:hypothetical protein
MAKKPSLLSRFKQSSLVNQATIVAHIVAIIAAFAGAMYWLGKEDNLPSGNTPAALPKKIEQSADTGNNVASIQSGNINSPQINMRDLVVNQQATADSPSEPYDYHLYKNQRGVPYVVELRPTQGKWSPPIVGIPKDEVETTRWLVSVAARVADSGRAPSFTEFGAMRISERDAEYATATLDENATPDKSVYIYFNKLPSKIIFGSVNGNMYELIPRNFE